MTIQVKCSNPGCGESASIPDEYLGRTLRCAHCRQTFTASSDISDESDTYTAPVKVTSKPRARSDHILATQLLRDDGQSRDVKLPSRIGRFEIREELGRGAFGAVFRAFDPQLEREVALKVPRAEMLKHPQAVERFLREAKAAARLRHPHIVPIHDAGREGDTYFIVSAFIAGRTLASEISVGLLDVRRAAQIVRDLAEAVDCAHRSGIVHRDVKPANIMVDEEGQVHLMDFGLAHCLDSQERLTHDGTILGTPVYMAPEQATGTTGDPNPASDQYSLGVILFELLCGHTPFSGRPEMVIYNAIHQLPPAPSSIQPQIPRDLEAICLKALSKQPSARFATCRELADALGNYLVAPAGIDSQPLLTRNLVISDIPVNGVVAVKNPAPVEAPAVARRNHFRPMNKSGPPVNSVASRRTLFKWLAFVFPAILILSGAAITIWFVSQLSELLDAANIVESVDEKSRGLQK